MSLRRQLTTWSWSCLTHIDFRSVKCSFLLISGDFFTLFYSRQPYILWIYDYLVAYSCKNSKPRKFSISRRNKCRYYAEWRNPSVFACSSAYTSLGRACTRLAAGNESRNQFASACARTWRRAASLFAYFPICALEFPLAGRPPAVHPFDLHVIFLNYSLCYELICQSQTRGFFAL